jgi:ribosomal protein S21
VSFKRDDLRQVTAEPGENFERLLTRFLRKSNYSALLREHREHSRFTRPGEVRRRERKRGIQNARRRAKR